MRSALCQPLGQRNRKYCFYLQRNYILARQIKDGYLGKKKKVHNYQLRAYAGSQFPHL